MRHLSHDRDSSTLPGVAADGDCGPLGRGVVAGRRIGIDLLGDELGGVLLPEA
jgi:hypothetical protein